MSSRHVAKPKAADVETSVIGVEAPAAIPEPSTDAVARLVDTILLARIRGTQVLPSAYLGLPDGALEEASAIVRARLGQSG